MFKCAYCNGSGVTYNTLQYGFDEQDVEEEMCPYCNGSGESEFDEKPSDLELTGNEKPDIDF